jgi:hypothetical membrane protein
MNQPTAKKAPINQKWSHATQVLLVAGVIGPILFVLVATIAGLLRPGYSVMSEAISNLGVGTNAWIQNSNFIITGLLFIAFAFGFYQRMQTVIRRVSLNIITFLLLLAGAALTIECFFSTDIPGYPPQTIHGTVHDTTFLVIFVSLMIVFFIVGWQLRKTPSWRKYSWYSNITGMIAVVLLIVNFYTSDHVPQVAGLIERIFIVVTFAWYARTGYQLLTREQFR